MCRGGTIAGTLSVLLAIFMGVVLFMPVAALFVKPEAGSAEPPPVGPVQQSASSHAPANASPLATHPPDGGTQNKTAEDQGTHGHGGGQGHGDGGHD